MRLNASEPYGTIYGDAPIPGACFEQNGQYFRANGDLIGDPPPEPVKRAAVSDDYRSMSNARLKELASVYSIEWTRREDVIAQMEGRG